MSERLTFLLARKVGLAEAGAGPRRRRARQSGGRCATELAGELSPGELDEAFDSERPISAPPGSSSTARSPSTGSGR